METVHAAYFWLLVLTYEGVPRGSYSGPIGRGVHIQHFFIGVERLLRDTHSVRVFGRNFVSSTPDLRVRPLALEQEFSGSTIDFEEADLDRRPTNLERQMSRSDQISVRRVPVDWPREAEEKSDQNEKLSER